LREKGTVIEERRIKMLHSSKVSIYKKIEKNKRSTLKFKNFTHKYSTIIKNKEEQRSWLSEIINY
jgi:hypothetical protein